MIGRRDLFFCAQFASFHTHASLLTFFVCFFILFRSCCSHASVFGETHVHEFPMSYSHTEWYLNFFMWRNRLFGLKLCLSKSNEAKLLLLLLLIELSQLCKVGKEWIYYQSEDPNSPQPMRGKKKINCRKEKKEQIRPTGKHWLCF